MVGPGMLLAGAARRTINPELGTRQTGFRLFGNPVQAIESDLIRSPCIRIPSSRAVTGALELLGRL